MPVVETKTEVKAPVAKTVYFRKSVSPWERHVPIEARNWRYDLAEGSFVQAEQDWVVSRKPDGDVDKVVDGGLRVAKQIVKDGRPESPVFTWAQVEACVNLSINTRKPLKDAFKETLGDECSKKFLDQVAKGPVLIVAGYR